MLRLTARCVQVERRSLALDSGRGPLLAVCGSSTSIAILTIQVFPHCFTPQTRRGASSICFSTHTHALTHRKRGQEMERGTKVDVSICVYGRREPRWWRD